MSKTLEDALELIEEMANTQSLWSNERAIPRKGGSNGCGWNDYDEC